jgi:glyoxylase-like metal-dependent hydrolase (beta-lactamase superfamily II)
MSNPPTRVVTDSMLGLQMPDIDVWSERVTVVLGQNPGPFTGPGTNTYLVGTGRKRILLDTGEGLTEYLPLLDRALRETCRAEGLERIVLTHGHPDHMGGVESLRQHFGSVAVLKKPWPDRDGDISLEVIDEGSVVKTEGATLRAIWTPGHAWDHLCFYLEEEKALFTGDVVPAIWRTIYARCAGFWSSTSR